MASSNHSSSTLSVLDAKDIPRHIAVVMDGNGRWAKQHMLPRVAGHKRGVESVRGVVRRCVERGVEFLTLFAFSSENWRRPPDEVKFLMQLFIIALEREIEKLHRNGVCFRVIGDLSKFDEQLVQLIHESSIKTQYNQKLTLTIAANYGGRWDILQAVNRMLAEDSARAQNCSFSEADLAPHLSMHYAPEPDLFIRSGGEQRVSNFLLWQLAYTELYFTDKLWPDFDASALDEAIRSYQRRERRFGHTSEQMRTIKASAPAAFGA